MCWCSCQRRWQRCYLNVSKIGFRNTQKHLYTWTILLLCEYLKNPQNLNSKNWVTLCTAYAISSCRKSTEQYWLWFLSSRTCTKYFIRTNCNYHQNFTALLKLEFQNLLCMYQIYFKMIQVKSDITSQVKLLYHRTTTIRRYIFKLLNFYSNF